MTQQKCNRHTKAQGHRKGALTGRIETVGGASAVTVNEQALQLGLRFGTAENPQGSVGEAAGGQPSAATHAEPKPKHKKQSATSATMEEVCCSSPSTSEPRESRSSLAWDRRGRKPAGGGVTTAVPKSRM